MQEYINPQTNPLQTTTEKRPTFTVGAPDDEDWQALTEKNRTKFRSTCSTRKKQDKTIMARIGIQSYVLNGEIVVEPWMETIPWKEVDLTDKEQWSKTPLQKPPNSFFYEYYDTSEEDRKNDYFMEINKQWIDYRQKSIQQKEQCIKQAEKIEARVAQMQKYNAQNHRRNQRPARSTISFLQQEGAEDHKYGTNLLERKCPKVLDGIENLYKSSKYHTEDDINKLKEEAEKLRRQGEEITNQLMLQNSLVPVERGRTLVAHETCKSTESYSSLLPKKITATAAASITPQPRESLETQLLVKKSDIILTTEPEYKAITEAAEKLKQQSKMIAETASNKTASSRLLSKKKKSKKQCCLPL